MSTIKLILLLFLMGISFIGVSQARVDSYDSITVVTDDMYFWVLDPNADPQSHRISVYRLDQRYIQNGQILSVSEMDVTTELTSVLIDVEDAQIQYAIIDTLEVDSAYFSKLVADSLVVNRFVLSSDPGADRILFWDESSDSTDYLTAGTGLTITGTTITTDVTLTGSETLTNKTLTSPVISTITNSGGDITLTPNTSNHVNISAGGLEIGGTEVISSTGQLSYAYAGSSANTDIQTITAYWGASGTDDVARIILEAGSDTGNKDDGQIILQTQVDNATGLKNNVKCLPGQITQVSGIFRLATASDSEFATMQISSGKFLNNYQLQLSFYGAGTLTTDASGNVTATSDARLKNVQRSFGRGIEDILKLNPIVYKWRPESNLDTSSEYTGFLAQDVQKVIPEAVFYNKEKDSYSFSDRAIIAALVNAVKDQQGQIEDLRKEIKKLKRN